MFASILSILFILFDLSVVFRSRGTYSYQNISPNDMLEKAQWSYLNENWRLHTSKSEVTGAGKELLGQLKRPGRWRHWSSSWARPPSHPWPKICVCKQHISYHFYLLPSPLLKFSANKGQKRANLHPPPLSKIQFSKQGGQNWELEGRMVELIKQQ